ncbi:uncharacterized protein K460DRAFT_135999 [Cucurbitaria berberidis CBS 394.84]|uniref:Uncharacterized protein n=1 Tax=Cucurbitaria berberidis CBS 394.84 TaxID=1168544 RepID=A0A9P4GCB6_9PLEO|nr:uncharacterized protein K460DRAFT_135999 [Cucurbitaria berberidis CBS 394.84]KAF1842894.1 hypothetical protein K460DRAFT_135999 [Cucurbitaria berberidis CBS 394.84]
MLEILVKLNNFLSSCVTVKYLYQGVVLRRNTIHFNEALLVLWIFFFLPASMSSTSSISSTRHVYQLPAKLFPKYKAVLRKR